MSDELRVPKHKVAVEVLLPGGAARKVMFFLAEFAGAHAGHERLSDLLNGEAEFVPALDLATDNMSFLGRRSIAVARVAAEWEPPEDPALATEHPVELALVDGSLLHGTVAFVMPPERSRLLDFLNDEQPFVRLAEQDHVALVNKRHIARVARVK